ncbi:MAG: hypothetical protein HZY76_19765 [Anaerolineae bacterium]|nr:MAG: hypothetical protein HZY76_19765 [Anaerolineae bacterium]
MKRHRNILLSGLLLLLVSFLWGGALTASAQETITNTAVITADNDTNPANNTASVTLGQCVAIANTATVSSSNEDSNSANNTSTVLVEDCNSTYAVNDINQTPVNVPVSGDVLTNDFDLEGDNQTVTGALVDRNGDGQLNEVLPIGMPTAIYGVDNQGTWSPPGRSR